MTLSPRGRFAAQFLSFLLATTLPSSAATRAVSVSPTSISFGNLAVNTTAAQLVTVQNTGSLNVTVSSATFSAPGFATSGLVLPLTLSPRQSATFEVIYAPVTAASNSATLYLRRPNGAVLASIALTGSATASAQALDTMAPTVSVTSPANGAWISGTVTLAANASDNIGVAKVQFYVGSTAIGGVLTAAPYAVSWDTRQVTNGSGYIVTAIAWDAAGNRTQSAGISTSVSNVAPQHSATLTWMPSPSSIIGYYVYRSTQAGGPYTRMTSGPSATTSFTDTAVTSGLIYYYVVTAVDANGVESGYSNQTVAQIP